MSIKLSNILNEVKINNPDPYKYKVGETVRELYGDEESCKILDRRPNWEAVEKNPVEKKYIFQYPDPDPDEDDNTMNEPWYLIQWLEHNKDATPVWWIEEELQPYDNINETKINNPNPYKYKIGEIVREIAGDEEVGEILDRRPNWAAVKANPVLKKFIEQPMYFDKEYSEGNSEPWYLMNFLNPEDLTVRNNWYAESELQPYSLNESIITNTNNKKKTISIDGYDNVSYKFMPNTKFVELRIDNSPQYIARHKKDLGYAPDNSVMSNTFKESTLNRIVKNLRNNNIKAIVIDDAILMTNTNNINENINEIKINTPDLGYKIADWVYKYFTEDPYDYDHEKAEVELGPDEAMAMGILWRNMNIFDKNNVTVGDIEHWRNEPGSNLKDSTEDEIIYYLTSLVLIKKNQSLNEVKINQPTPGLPVDFTNNVKDAINRHIVSLVKEHEGYYETPAVEFVKDEKYGTHDAVIEFIKEHMVVNHYEFEKDGKEIIASPLNSSTISDEDVLDYLNDNTELKRYINKVIWKAYFETVDIGDVRNQVFNYITKKEHPDLPHQRNTKEYFDVYIPLLIDKVVDYYIEPSEIFTENDFIQLVNNTLLKSNFINEIKINKPAILRSGENLWVDEEDIKNLSHESLSLLTKVYNALLPIDKKLDDELVLNVSRDDDNTIILRYGYAEPFPRIVIDALEGFNIDIESEYSGDDDRGELYYCVVTEKPTSEIKINNPGNIKNYRISWYEESDQFAQEEIETTLSNAERIAINKLKTQYNYRNSYEYWVIIDQNIGDDIITRWEDVERIVLDPEPDGLYARIKIYDEDKREFVTTKTIKL